MYLSSTLLAIPLLAVQATAFLIPPNANSDVAVTVVPQEDVRTKSILTRLPHVVALECPDCPFEGRDGVENKIELIFEASSSTGLVINGVPVPSSAFDALAAPISISAHQVSLSDGERTQEQPLDFAMEKLPAVAGPHTDDLLMPVRFTVLAIGGVAVKTDTVVVHMLRTDRSRGQPELLLLHTGLIPFQDTPGATSCDGQNGWSLCRIKAIVVAQVQAMMEMMIKHKENAKGWVKNGCGGRFAGHGGPRAFGWKGGRPDRVDQQHHQHRHHGHRDWRIHRFHLALHRSLKFFFIPALLGIIGGLMASAVGMLVGRILIFLWQTFYRGSQQGQVRFEEVEIFRDPDEKVLLLEEVDVEDAPPVYTDIEIVAGEKQ